MEYDSIIKTAYEENPFPKTPARKRGRKKKSKVLNLICRLDDYKELVCLFIKNLCVPFDNNQAERDLRMVKVKTKVSGCFRSEKGTGISYNHELYRISSQARNKRFHSDPQSTERNLRYHF